MLSASSFAFSFSQALKTMLRIKGEDTAFLFAYFASYFFAVFAVKLLLKRKDRKVFRKGRTEVSNLGSHLISVYRAYNKNGR